MQRPRLLPPRHQSLAVAEKDDAHADYLRGVLEAVLRLFDRQQARKDRQESAAALSSRLCPLGQGGAVTEC